MDFRELSYIAAIAKHGNITKASDEVFVSQPTLSKFVQNLEHRLGQPLFRRMGNKFLLTYAGERYLEKAQAILTMKKELDLEMSDIIKKNIGELKIAFPIMRGNYILPLSLPVFKKQFPLVKVTVREDDSAVLEDMLLSGEIDLAFFSLPVRSPDITYDVISDEEVLLVMSPGHPLVKSGVKKEGCRYLWMDISKLKDEEFILQKLDQRTRQIADKIFRGAEFSPKISLAIRNIVASAQLAAGGYGVTFTTETHLKHIDFKTPPACFSVGNPYTTTSFVAAYRRKSYLPGYTKQFIKIVKEVS